MGIIKWIGIILLIFIVIVAIFGIFRFYKLGKASQTMQVALGVTETGFVSCPQSPNCVNSYQQGSDHGIETLTGGAQDFAALAAHISSTTGAEISVLSENYLWATYQSGIFGFVDDLELYHDGRFIQVRSASRVGYSDLGANKARVESLRAYLEAR